MGHSTKEVVLENATGDPITDINFLHRYDNDINNTGYLTLLSVSESKKICMADFWTGWLRTGYDYWWIEFKRSGKKYTCKANFYCYLTLEDANSDDPVRVKVEQEYMYVCPPKSSSCWVKLMVKSDLTEEVTAEHLKSGIQDNQQSEDKSKKCNSIR